MSVSVSILFLCGAAVRMVKQEWDRFSRDVPRATVIDSSVCCPSAHLFDLGHIGRLHAGCVSSGGFLQVMVSEYPCGEPYPAALLSSERYSKRHLCIVYQTSHRNHHQQVEDSVDDGAWITAVTSDRPSERPAS